LGWWLAGRVTRKVYVYYSKFRLNTQLHVKVVRHQSGDKFRAGKDDPLSRHHAHQPRAQSRPQSEHTLVFGDLNSTIEKVTVPDIKYWFIGKSQKLVESVESKTSFLSYIYIYALKYACVLCLETQLITL
jgi:hypothetical protein